MRIAVVTSSFPRRLDDGNAQFVRSLVASLATFGHEIEVVAPYDVAVQPYSEHAYQLHRFKYIWPNKLHIMGHARALHNDVRLRPLAYALFPLFFLSELMTLEQVVRKQQSQIIYAHWVIPNGLAAALVAKMHRLPLIISLHGSDLYLAKRNKLFGQIARWIFRHACAVTACSQRLQKDALSLGAPSQTSLIPWGVDPKRFHPDNEINEWRKEFGLDPDAAFVLCLGRLVPKKGFHILLQAWPMILEKHPSAKLVVAGDGPQRSELEVLSRDLGIENSVCFAGAIPWTNVPSLLASADLFVLPSIEDKKGNVDGLPTVLLEAMSSGTPIVASRIAGISLVIEDAQTGILVPPEDPHRLAIQIIDQLSNPDKRNRLARRARLLVQNELSWRHCTSKIDSMLEDCYLR